MATEPMAGRSRRSSRHAVRLAVFLMILLGTAGAARAQAASAGTPCRAVSVPVTVAGGIPETIRGQLCLPAGATTVQVLIPGATCSVGYWDFPYEPDRYSYVDALASAGYATLDINTLGVGDSSRPPSALVAIESDASAVHQVIQAARNGAFGPHFPRVIAVGHSMGTAVAWHEAAVYHDIDGLIATGNVHLPSVTGASQGLADLYPADLDPRFAPDHLDPRYLTTRPGTRGPLFYNEADADPTVIALDERTKDVATYLYAGTYFAEDADADTARISVPVLLADGQDDHLMCTGVAVTDCSSSSALLASEAPYYTGTGCLSAYVLPSAGHDLNLSLNARSFFAEAVRWSDTWIGPRAPSPHRRCAATGD
ncbi:MAG: alpha/beta hydrolase [Streptosporangiales bacterium]|nr:alpha/beta hydrolase [Streptosporangiales bacterium]